MSLGLQPKLLSEKVRYGRLLVWKVKPMPNPSTIRYPTIFPKEISGPKVV
jgi:hypothetical protein